MNGCDVCGSPTVHLDLFDTVEACPLITMRREEKAMKATEMMGFVNKVAIYPVKEMAFLVRILEVKAAPYGRVDVLISPIEGDGEQWVAITSVKVKE